MRGSASKSHGEPVARLNIAACARADILDAGKLSNAPFHTIVKRERNYAAPLPPRRQILGINNSAC